MDICFIVPPNPTSLEDKIDPHLGVLSIAAVVRESGQNVYYVDWREGDREEVLPPADVYGITSYGINYREAVSISGICKQVCPSSKVVLGGPIASALPQYCLNDFDAVFIGEGEGAFLDFLGCQEVRRYYFGHYGPYIEGSNPPPAYDLVDWSKYSRLVLGQRAFGLMTSRGCPYKCSFCQNDRSWSSFRRQPDGAVSRDIQFCREVTGFDAVTFWDNTFELRLDHSFLEMIGEKNVIFSYQSRGVVNGLEEEIYQAGGRIVFIGLETGDPALLRRMNKGLTLDQIKEAVYRLQEVGISARCGILFGFPGETEETLERTRKFVEEIRPHQTFLSFFAPFPGSDVWQNPAKYGVTWMAPWDRQRMQDKESWVEASVETLWMKRDKWNRLAVEMMEWWKALPRRKEADHSWWRSPKDNG